MPFNTFRTINFLTCKVCRTASNYLVVDHMAELGDHVPKLIRSSDRCIEADKMRQLQVLIKSIFQDEIIVQHVVPPMHNSVLM